MRGPNWFDHLNQSSNSSFNPSFGFALISCAFTVAHILHKIKTNFVRIKSCKSFELVPSFMKQYTVFTHFSMATLKLGLKQGGIAGSKRGPKTG